MMRQKDLDTTDDPAHCPNPAAHVRTDIPVDPVWFPRRLESIRELVPTHHPGPSRNASPELPFHNRFVREIDIRPEHVDF